LQVCSAILIFVASSFTIYIFTDIAMQTGHSGACVGGDVKPCSINQSAPALGFLAHLSHIVRRYSDVLMCHMSYFVKTYVDSCSPVLEWYCVLVGLHL